MLRKKSIVLSDTKENSNKKLKSYEQKEYKVLIENITFDGKYYIGRSYMDIPDTDGVIIIKNTKDNLIGQFVNCKITGSKDYDLIGEII